MSKLYEHWVCINEKCHDSNRKISVFYFKGIVVGVFMACWLPFFIMYLRLAYCDYKCVNPSLERYITWIGRCSFCFSEKF
jgi:hypothetical protein